jgi:ketosteroid isomerase-like protein
MANGGSIRLTHAYARFEFMHRNKLILSAALLLTMTALCWAASPVESVDDAQAVEQANARFYKSLNAMFIGDASPMTEVWSHADDVIYMGPAGGIQVGWDRIGVTWASQAALKLGGEVQADESHAVIGDNLAIVQCREVGHNLDSDGNPQDVSIRATNVFRKEAGAWKMIGHHTDLLPFLEQEPLTSATK